MDSFSFLHTFPSTIVFKLEFVLLYQFYAKITVFFIKKCAVWLLSKALTSKGLPENDVKNWKLRSGMEESMLLYVQGVL